MCVLLSSDLRDAQQVGGAGGAEGHAGGDDDGLRRAARSLRFSAVATASSVISATFITSWQSTALTPHTSARRRAVARRGVMPMIGARGRSRAMRSAE